MKLKVTATCSYTQDDMLSFRKIVQRVNLRRTKLFWQTGMYGSKGLPGWPEVQLRVHICLLSSEMYQGCVHWYGTCTNQRILMSIYKGYFRKVWTARRGSQIYFPRLWTKNIQQVIFLILLHSITTKSTIPKSTIPKPTIPKPTIPTSAILKSTILIFRNNWGDTCGVQPCLP